MKDIITLENGQEIALDNNLVWLMEYQDQFGEDIVPTLMPLIMSFADLLGGLADAGVDIDKLEVSDIVGILKTEAALNAAIKLSTFSSTDLINIIWALAKAADDTIPPPRKWIRQFEDGFPLDLIVPKAAAIVAKGVVSSKNFERLTADAKDKLQPKKAKTKKSK